MQGKLRKLSVAVAFAVALSMAGSPVLMAGDGAEVAPEGGLLGFLRNIVGWPVRTTQNLGDATVDGVQGVGDGFGEMGAATGEVFSGDIAKTPDIVGRPGAKAVDNTGEFLTNIGEAPAKQRDWEQ